MRDLLKELTKLMKTAINKLADWGEAASYAIHH